MEHKGIVTKTADPEHGSKWIYKLTPKGIDLMPLLTEMIVWSAKHDKKTAADKDFGVQATTDRKKLLAELKAALK